MTPPPSTEPAPDSQAGVPDAEARMSALDADALGSAMMIHADKAHHRHGPVLACCAGAAYGAGRARDREQAELDRTEIQAYAELLDRLAKSTGAENYVEAVVLAARAHLSAAKAEGRIGELEAALKDSIDSIWERHRYEMTDDCEDARCSTCDQVMEARALLKEAPDA